MGGIGSGRRSGFGRDTVEGCRSLDIDRLHKAGCLAPGHWGGWEWSRDGQRIASISMRAHKERLVLVYNVRCDGGEWQSVEEPVPITRAPCRYGGTRPYFLCPGVVNGIACGRRVAKLYLDGRYFLCRHCYRLGYASQSEGALDRARRKATKLRHRLGSGSRWDEPTPPRPKGMWRRTYERRRRQILEAEFLADELFEVEAAGLIARLMRHDRTKRFWS